MKLNKKMLVTSCLLALLSGCNEKLTLNYLMQHPQLLKREIDRCQTLQQKTSEEVMQCGVVMSAMEKITVYINEQQQDPEKFGQKILTLQITGNALTEEQREELKTRLAVVGMNSPE